MDSLEFILKKTVSALFYPVGISLLLLLVGLATCKLKRSSRVGNPPYFCGDPGSVVTVFSYHSFLAVAQFRDTGGVLRRPKYYDGKRRAVCSGAGWVRQD